MPRKPRGTWDRRRGVWVAALGDWYQPDGRDYPRRRVVTLTYPDGTPVDRNDEAGRNEAIARLLRLNAERDRRGLAPLTGTLLRDWIEWHEIVNKSTDASTDSRRTLAKRVANLPWLNGTIGDVPIDEFGPEHLLNGVRGGLRACGATEGSIRNHESIVLAALRWAAQAIEGREPLVMLTTNPFPPGSVRMTKGYRSKRPCPSWPDLLAILDKLDEHVETRRNGLGARQRARARINALWVRVIAERGCRPLETAYLRVEHWDADRGGFTLDRHKTSRYSGPGAISLRPETAARVQALIDRPDRVGPWVFWPEMPEERQPRKPSVTLTVWWRKQRGSIGAEAYELYSFRNTLSNALRAAGIDDRGMRVALRQGSAVAESVYRRDHLDAAADVFRRAGLS